MKSIKEALEQLPRPPFDSSDVYEPPAVDICPICKGAGWLRMDVPPGHPSFGRLLKCECAKRTQDRERIAELRRISQLDGLEDRSFDTFEAETPDQIRALETARTFSRNLSSWLVVSGGVGTGKTHLAAAIANDVLDRGGNSVMFTVAPDLLDHLRATFDPTRGIGYDERFTTIRNTFLLVLDDLGTENATPWAKEKLYQIINHRYNERLPTVITTNQRDDAIDERILSRMLDRDLSTRVALSGDDYRRRGDPTYMRGRKRRS